MHVKTLSLARCLRLVSQTHFPTLGRLVSQTFFLCFRDQSPKHLLYTLVRQVSQHLFKY
jgi:hypothetical protein